VTSVALQWLVYDDWMHQTGPVRLIGTAIAAILTFMFIYKWLLSERARQAELLRRFEVIAQMNDRIRNAVQAIACTNFAYHPEAAQDVRQAVGIIDEALRGVVDSFCTPPRNIRPQTMSANAAARKGHAQHYAFGAAESAR